MGAFHFGVAVLGAEPVTVRQSVVRWLAAKGLDPVEGPPIGPLDPSAERGLFLATAPGRALLHYSALGEQDRLVFELAKLGVPVLTYWLADSDVWGYELHVDGSVVSAFNSDPHYGGGDEPPAGPDDLSALAQAVGTDVDLVRLRRLRGKRAVFAERVARDFLAELGLGPLATCYDYGHEGDTSGFELDHLVFRREGWDPMADFSVERLRLRTAEPQPLLEAPEVLRQLRSARRIGRVAYVLVWPILLLVRALAWALRIAPSRAESEPPPRPFRVDGRRLVSDRYGVRVDLAEGTSPSSHLFPFPAGNLVFEFALGESAVRVEAITPAMAEARSTVGMAGSTLDVRDLATPLGPARRVCVVEPEGARGEDQGSWWHLLGFVQGPRAIFLFASSGVGEPDVAAFDATLQTLAPLARAPGPATRRPRR